MAKAPKPADEMIEDAELLKSVDDSVAGAPLLLTDPERRDLQDEMQTAEPDASERSAPQDPAPQSTPSAPERSETAAPPSRREPTPPPQQGVFLPMVLGGALAAVAGFAASHYDLLKLAPPPADTTALKAALAEQSAQITGLAGEVARLAAAPAPDAGLAEEIAALQAQVSALAAAPPPAGEAVDLSPLTDRLQAMESQIAAIEAMPATDGTGVSPAALAALQAEVEALKSSGGAEAEALTRAAEAAEARIAEAEARAAALSDSLAATAQATTTRAAVGRLQAALETGAPFGSALTDLGEEPPPAVLQDAATAGLPTLADLEDSFPAAARSALEAALRANMGESWTERVSSFLRAQTGARSLAPREGSDPDAILSRAEAAIGAGDVAGALAEAKALPDAGLAAMSGWVAAAEQRLSAEAAVADLVSRLGN